MRTVNSGMGKVKSRGRVFLKGIESRKKRGWE